MNDDAMHVRLDVQPIALRAILKALARPHRAEVAAGLRAGLEAMLAERGSLPAEADEAATAELAALLDAAGQPARLMRPSDPPRHANGFEPDPGFQARVGRDRGGGEQSESANLVPRVSTQHRDDPGIALPVCACRPSLAEHMADIGAKAPWVGSVTRANAVTSQPELWHRKGPTPQELPCRRWKSGSNTRAPTRI